jgi:hypothetical protein
LRGKEVRYPYDLDNATLNQYLGIFNRFAGSADEMGSYIKYLKRELAMIENRQKEKDLKNEQIISELKVEIDKLNAKYPEAIKWKEKLDEIDLSDVIFEIDGYPESLTLPSEKIINNFKEVEKRIKRFYM